MKALRFESGRLQLSEVPRPQRPDEALVRVTLAGICSTDLHITKGYAGYSGTLGHEFVGVVESSPEADQVGRRVVGEINAGCGHCALCRTGDSRHCAERTVLGIIQRDGAFADYVSLPPRNLLQVRDRISDQEAVFAEPLAAACQILDQVEINRGSCVAVIGDGKLAQLVARVLATTGCDLTVIGKHASKLALLRSTVSKTLHVGEVGKSERGRHDFVVEASGSESGLNLAIDLVRPKGTIVLKSTFHGSVPLEAWRVVVNEVQVIGSRCGRISRAIELLEEGAIDLEGLIADEFPLEDGLTAMAVAAQPGVLKVLIRP
jgi:threonine dehydrogenase-like Zn-dependent dehydrogenase